MRALVTGGAGFIGSNIVDALLARGDEVTVLDDVSTGRRENLEGALAGGAELVEDDIRDAQAAALLFERLRPEVVFHLAAQIDVRRSIADAAFDARVNVEGTINLLEAARRVEGIRFVNTSTGGAIYGEGRILPATEEHPVAPEAGYGQSKFAAEGYCDLYSRLHGVSTVSLRYGNVFGPRQDPLGEAGVIAIFCGRLLAGERPTIFGDGLQTRDYVYVGDIVEANLAAAESSIGGPVNIGRGVPVSLVDLVAALSKSEGRDLDPEFAPPRPGEVQHIHLDAARARAELGWQARTGLEDGLALTLDSLR
ncbi:MAG: UDP-glucose 4-epimerase [uncultured Solirubrobacterales bacterium]|uniref:UDP-glucose 4-epimerase n=1 Tax=uncultured Solirubrobacterales bacterium TaxID=768556 RepID=A0A6J4RZZ3_9ACTN|nr:MAG: UDP-glucose 4-epimerase [uncultured Solirubrobacterales bacterium]